MAELILGSVVDSITGQLASLVSREIGLASGVKAELGKLQDTIAAISALLREAEKRQVEAEDALRRQRATGRGKRILYEVLIFFSSSNQLIYASKMAHRVMEIRGRIDAIKSDKLDCNVGENNNLASFVENRPRPETYPFDSEPYVIGRKNAKKEVVQFLLNPDFEENVSILAICFAYCSLFPKDYELDPLELINIWMAQGFIGPLGNKKTVEAVGHDYFMEQLSRSFFQDIEEDNCGNIVRCKMHDLMHDLAQSVAGDICITIDSSHAKSLPKGARHVSITFDLDEIKGFERDQRIRSLFLMVEKRILIALLEVSCFRNLRALRIRAVNIKAISKSIGKLKHLRSLDLSENYKLTSLPNSISRLCNLEILNLSGCFWLEGLPRGITKLVNLRQLDLIDCHALTHMPRGIGKLTSLQMLNVFVVGKKSNKNAARLNELSRLAGILLRNKQLRIEGLENVESISNEEDASFSVEKFAIQELGLHWGWAPHGVRANEEEIELRGLNKFKGWERRSRRDNRVGHEEDILEEEEEDHSSLLMLCGFADNVKIRISDCPEFSYMQGEQLHMSVTTIKLLEQLLRNAADHSDPHTGHHPTNFPTLAVPNPSTSKMTLISKSSIPVFSLTSLAIDSMNDADHLLMELFQSVPSLKSLAIGNLSRLKALSGRAILRGVRKTRSLPGWFQYLTNLQELTIIHCVDLKSLPRRLFLQLLTTLESLSLCDNPELDLSTTWEAGDQEDMSNLQFGKLRELTFLGQQMETLPWWIQHLTNLEHLEIYNCSNLKALPAWFPQLTSLQHLEVNDCGEELTRRCKRNTGEDWPKISHIPHFFVA
ncbi:hypothetical protein CRG98_026352 [Punica granatum]|uniref:Uncharacterized protein n=1 Tax=Punica granatum TaxID=22663 RepID=A0A2I0JBB9_PUNGR|nr:hypothetical protein CRG98_026352 [Punica granatum]